MYECQTYFKYLKAVGCLIYITNAIEKFNRQYRKTVEFRRHVIKNVISGGNENHQKMDRIPEKLVTNPFAT